MVYDQARNRIGDTYWKESHELQEGEELKLDGGVMVEVSEAMGITHTDLTPLFEKKTKEPGKEPPVRATPSGPRPFQRPTSVAPSNVPRASTQLRHKSLNTLLGTPKGPVGKAVPMKSPYEERREKEKENAGVEERAAKRQKTTQRPGGWRASSPAQEEPSSPLKPVPKTTQTAKASTTHSANIFTISSECDQIPVVTSDVTLPSTPEGLVKSRPRLPFAAAPTIDSNMEKPPIAQPPKIPRGKVPVASTKIPKTPKPQAPNSSPPVSASNRLTNVDFAVQPAAKLRKEPTPPPSPPCNPKAKSLRLSAGVKRGTLLCQSLPQQASRVGSEARTLAAKPGTDKAIRKKSKEPSPRPIPGGICARSGQQIDIGNQTIAKGKRKPPDVTTEVISRKARRVEPPQVVSQDVFDDPEIMHGIMDQQLLIPSSPAELHHPSSPPPARSPATKPAPAKSVKRPDQNAVEQSAAVTSYAGLTKAKSPTLKGAKTKTAPKKKALEKQRPARPSPPAPALVFEPHIPLSRDVSPTHTETSTTYSWPVSTSPQKPLSNGGFRKKPKHTSKPLLNTTTPAPELRNVSIPLPPGPTQPSRRPPLMSTSDLASLLQKPKKRTKTHDPIEDDVAGSSKETGRGFRRVRSANDAPIPSTAGEWEERNLPRGSNNLPDNESVGVGTADTEDVRRKGGLAALVKRTDPRKKFLRTKSLNVDTSVGVGVEEGNVELPSPVLDEDVGPWSTEAGDLFDWRPPGR
jgi:hypothetical protein